MRRRSSMANPIRPSELFDLHDAAVSRRSVVPRQLDFDRNPSRTSIAGKSINVRPAAHVPQRSRFSLAPRAKNDVSVRGEVSLLSETISESPDDVTVQIPKVAVAPVSSVPLVQPSSISRNEKKPDNVKPKSIPANPRVSLLRKAPESLKKSQEIEKHNLGSAEKVKDSAELNSTAAFEGEEIAALTSTPHPERKSKNFVPSLSSAAENSELAEQMKLFIMDQRSLMQAVKLSFQKMNSVMDQMNSLMSKLNVEVDSQTQLKLVKKIDNEEMANPLQSLESECNSCETVLSSLVLNDDKENVDVEVANPVSMYSDLKSQLKCLKTPTALRARPFSAETPNTILSNALHKQLENLYETNEMDD